MIPLLSERQYLICNLRYVLWREHVLDHNRSYMLNVLWDIFLQRRWVAKLYWNCDSCPWLKRTCITKRTSQWQCFHILQGIVEYNTLYNVWIHLSTVDVQPSMSMKIASSALYLSLIGIGKVQSLWHAGKGADTLSIWNPVVSFLLLPDANCWPQSWWLIAACWIVGAEDKGVFYPESIKTLFVHSGQQGSIKVVECLVSIVPKSLWS